MSAKINIDWLFTIYLVGLEELRNFGCHKEQFTKLTHSENVHLHPIVLATSRLRS